LRFEPLVLSDKQVELRADPDIQEQEADLYDAPCRLRAVALPSLPERLLSSGILDRKMPSRERYQCNSRALTRLWTARSGCAGAGGIMPGLNSQNAARQL
jgi:hypothetical protein